MKRPTWKQARSVVLFAGGLIGVVYTTLADQSDRPTLLIMFAAMMGLPYFFHTDDKLDIHTSIPPPPPPAAPTVTKVEP